MLSPAVFQANGGGGYVNLETGQSVDLATVERLGGKVVAGIWSDAQGHPIGWGSQGFTDLVAAPAWATRILGMTQAERVAYEKSLNPDGQAPRFEWTLEQVQEWSFLNTLVRGSDAARQLAENPEYIRAALTPGGVDTSRMSAELLADFNTFQDAAALVQQNPPVVVLPSVERYLIGGYEYEAPRGSAEADALRNNIVPPGMEPTRTPEDQGGGGYSGGVVTPDEAAMAVDSPDESNAGNGAQGGNAPASSGGAMGSLTTSQKVGLVLGAITLWGLFGKGK